MAKKPRKRAIAKATAQSGKRKSKAISQEQALRLKIRSNMRTANRKLKAYQIENIESPISNNVLSVIKFAKWGKEKDGIYQFVMPKGLSMSELEQLYTYQKKVVNTKTVNKYKKDMENLTGISSEEIDYNEFWLAFNQIKTENPRTLTDELVIKMRHSAEYYTDKGIEPSKAMLLKKYEDVKKQGLSDEEIKELASKNVFEDF